MSVLLALFMGASVCMVTVGALIGILIFWIADQRGGHRSGRRVRSRRTTVPSRGHRPYRGGRVRV